MSQSPAPVGRPTRNGVFLPGQAMANRVNAISGCARLVGNAQFWAEPLTLSMPIKL